MIGRRFVQRDIQKRPQRQRILRPPGDPSLGINPFEIADQQQPKIDPWRQAGPPLLLRIKPPAQPLHKVIEMVSLQQLVQTLIERVTRTSRQRVVRNPDRFLPSPLRAIAHGHARIV